jgi:hypothetical protein
MSRLGKERSRENAALGGEVVTDSTEAPRRLTKTSLLPD